MDYRIININEYLFDQNDLQSHFDKNSLERIMSSRQSLCGYSLAVEMIKQRLDEGFRISFESSGRPYIIGDKMHFSISHSNNYVACIIDKFYCGIDIECNRNVSSNLINRMMSESEKEWIYDNIYGYKKDTAFLVLWTMKEAYLKTQSFNTILDAKKLDFVLDKRLVSDNGNMKCKTIIGDENIASMWYRK